MTAIAPRSFALALIVALPFPLRAQGATSLTPQLPRTWVSVGASALRGDFETAIDSSELRIYTVKHVHLVGAAVIELRHERPSGFGGGLRVSAFGGADRSKESKQYVRPGFGLPPPRESWDTARVDDVNGVSAAASIETPYVGVMAGVVIGHWPRRNDYPIEDVPDQSRAEPLVELRLGRTTGWRAELATHAHLPAPGPGPLRRLGFAYTNAESGQTYQFGVTNDGVYVGSRWIDRRGLEFEPFVSVWSSTRRQFGLTVRQRFYVRK